MVLHTERSDPRRILLVRLSHLGDVVHALPVFHALRERFPASELAWIVQPEFAGLLNDAGGGLPGLDRVLVFERRGGPRAWPRLASELAAFGADLAVDAQGNAKSALVTLASGAPRRIGLAREDWREPFGAHVLTESAPPLQKDGAVHALARMQHLASFVLEREAALRFDLGLSGPERHAGASELTARVGTTDAPLLLALSTPGDVRSWPAERWAELARAAARAGRDVLVISGPAEAELGEQLARELTDARVAHWVGQRGLRPLAALFTAAAERGGRLVACDSGPMHLAAACGLGVVALAGPQDARRTGPWPLPGTGSPHRVVSADVAPPCAPCLRRRCDHPQGRVCMEHISADAALAAIDEPLDCATLPCA